MYENVLLERKCERSSPSDEVILVDDDKRKVKMIGVSVSKSRRLASEVSIDDE
jgi:hypothetical protein